MSSNNIIIIYIIYITSVIFFFLVWYFSFFISLMVEKTLVFGFFFGFRNAESRLVAEFLPFTENPSSDNPFTENPSTGFQ